MTRVVVTDHVFAEVGEEAAVARSFGAEFAECQCATVAETAEAVSGADVVFVNVAPITETVLRGMAPGGTVIRYGIGYDNVDVLAARELGISVAHVPDYGIDTVADHSVACLLALLRKLPEYDRRVRRHGWCLPGELGSLPGFSSITVGLIGLGRIGSAVHKRLRVFGFTILASDPYVDSGADEVRLVELDELLTNSDAISLHAPLTRNTQLLLDANAFARMPGGSVVVNTSRGGLVDHDALADAIESGQLAGAALDVFDSEPLPAGSRLWSLPRTLLTPHTAFFSDDAVAALHRLAAREAERALAGEPLRCPVR